MKHLVRVFLLLVLLSTGEAFALCGCQDTNELCTGVTFQSAVVTTHEHPFVQPLKVPEPRAMQALAWSLALLIATVVMRRSVAYHVAR
jgi:hypothetical protein